MRWLALVWLAACTGDEAVECAGMVAIEVACDVTGFARDVDLTGLQLVEVYGCCDGTCYPAEGWSVTGDLFEGRCSCGTLELHALREP